MFKYRGKNLKGKWVKGEIMGKVKFIIESDFLKTNSIMKFAIGKGAKIEDYQQTLTEAETNGVRTPSMSQMCFGDEKFFYRWYK